MKDHFICLDVSTSTVGIAVFNINGELKEVNHINPSVKTIVETSVVTEKTKMPNLEVYHKKTDMIIINFIVIEEPMISNKNVVSTGQLNLFCGMLYSKIKSYYDCPIKYIDVDTIRRNAFPELSQKNVLWKPVPKKILNKSLTDYRKFFILSLVAQRYPDVVWMLNNNQNIKTENLDRADAIAVGLGYMIYTKQWQPTLKSLSHAVDFVENVITYEIFLKKLADKKLGDKNTKNSLSIEYLQKHFKINNFVNFAI
jgi:hypothetical protein